MLIIVVEGMEGNQKYVEIKRNFEHYRELLRLVLKVEDKELQTNILAAINSIPHCLNCMRKETDTKASQTGEDGQYIDLKYSDNSGKRKRKRSKKGPEVIPTKRIIEIISQEIIKPESEAKPKPSTSEGKSESTESENLEGLGDFVKQFIEGSVCESDVFPQDNLKYIERTMIEEFIAAYKRVDGLLPIQTAIKEKDFRLFQRQLYVLNKRNIDLNGILTEEDEQNLLELAVRSDCSFEYFDHLFKYGIQCDTIDSFNDYSILDVIIDSSNNTELFSYFLKKLPLDFLKIKNSDGYGVLHMCVKKNKFRMVQALLNHVDEALELKPLKVPEHEDTRELENWYKEAFSSISERKQIHDIKEAILNLQDTASGRTPLLVALSSQYFHIAYMLLNHLADPSIADYSGNDSQAFLNNGKKTKNKTLEDITVNVSTILKELRECS